MPYKDKNKQREYQAQWIQERRKTWIIDQGGQCFHCGENRLHCLDVDHIDCHKKVSHKIWSWSKVRREEELSKCQVLCKNCHAEKTSKDLNWGTYTHGNSGYRLGCRCNICKDTHSIRMKKYRNRAVLAQ